MNYVDIGGITLQKIQLCLSVADNKSFTKAAAQMHLSQPTLSKKIADLEIQLGIILFIRGKSSSVKVTPAGSELFKEWKKMLADFQDALLRATEIQACRNPRLVVTTTPSAQTEAFLLPVVHKFQERNPSIDVRIENESIADQLKGLLENEIDIVIVNSFRQELFDREDISWEVVLHCCWSVGMLRSNPLAQRKSICIEDLRMQGFVLPNDHFFAEMVNRICNEHGFTPRISYYTKYFSGMSLSVRRSNEIFITDRYMKEYYNPDCVYFDLPQTSSGVMMAGRANEANEEVLEFKKLALDYFGRMDNPHADWKITEIERQGAV